MRQRLNEGAFLRACCQTAPRTRCPHAAASQRVTRFCRSEGDQSAVAPQPPRSARRREVFAANSEPGRRRPTGRRLPAFGHRDQALALGQFPGGLARATDGFRLLAGLALGWFFIRLATLHLAKNARALHLLLEHPQSLIDVVVANEYLQNVSNRVAGAAMRAVDAAVNAF